MLSTTSVVAPSALCSTEYLMALSLGGAKGEAADELLLEHQVDREGGDDHEHRPGGDEVVVGEELPAEVGERGRDRPVAPTVLEQHRPEEVVEDPGELEGAE